MTTTRAGTRRPPPGPWRHPNLAPVYGFAIALVVTAALGFIIGPAAPETNAPTNGGASGAPEGTSSIAPIQDPATSRPVVGQLQIVVTTEDGAALPEQIEGSAVSVKLARENDNRKGKLDVAGMTIFAEVRSEVEDVCVSLAALPGWSMGGPAIREKGGLADVFCLYSPETPDSGVVSFTLVEP